MVSPKGVFKRFLRIVWEEVGRGEEEAIATCTDCPFLFLNLSRESRRGCWPLEATGPGPLSQCRLGESVFSPSLPGDVDAEQV